jgi:rare lipoprotein A
LGHFQNLLNDTFAFEKKVNEDSTLSWRKSIVTQKGEKGVQRLTYRVSTYDGKEVNRKLIKTETLQAPVTEITTQGTYVKVGKTHKGAASWYAFTGTLSAANPWLPIGSYVRVTNQENGKSVIVRINDRGPFVPGRIIDLDKVAFQKIASIGAGVINVTMEEIVN